MLMLKYISIYNNYFVQNYNKFKINLWSLRQKYRVTKLFIFYLIAIGISTQDTVALSQL